MARNTFEMNARANKVDKLVECIDLIAATVNAHGARNATKIKAADIIAMLEGWGDIEWRMVAAQAKCRIPSSTSREEVINIYRRRVAR